MGAYIKTDLDGKIKNLSDFKSEALSPVFEAIVNSIEAIEERNKHNMEGNQDRGKITIRIIRDLEQLSLINEDATKEEPKIKSFEVEDDGIGFNNENFDSFNTSDSTYKKNRGGKGLGHFFWLKAFNKISVESIYSENGEKKSRKFEFTLDKGLSQFENKIVPKDTPQKTIVKLFDFKESYRKKPTAYKTTEKIAQRILEHFLPYYIHKSAPSIIIKDGIETLSLNELYRKVETNIKIDNIKIGEEQFTIRHIKLYQTRNEFNKIVLCANNRAVKSWRKILRMTAFEDGSKSFYYAAYVSSDFLDAHVNVERTDFNIPDDIDDHDWYGGDGVSLNKPS